MATVAAYVVGAILILTLIDGDEASSKHRYRGCLFCIEITSEVNKVATYDRAWLRSQLSSWLHDKGLSTDDTDTFIDLGAMRIGQMLRATENQYTVDWTLNDDLSALPDDFVAIRTIRHPGNNGLFALHSTSSHEIENMQDRSGGQPLYYQLRGGKIAVRPFVSGTYELTYWGRTDIDEQSTATHPALQAYPYLFLNAALEAGYQWKQDEQLRLSIQSQWLGEVREINRVAARRDAGDAPAQRAM
jgi:hypothetical protein